MILGRSVERCNGIHIHAPDASRWRHTFFGGEENGGYHDQLLLRGWRSGNHVVILCVGRRDTLLTMTRPVLKSGMHRVSLRQVA